MQEIIKSGDLKKAIRQANNRKLTDSFEFQWKTKNLPIIKKQNREVRFHPKRRWRFDYGFIIFGIKIAIELEGGTWIHGGHNRGKIYQDNCDKYNEATSQEWLLFRFTGDDVTSGNAVEYMEKFLLSKIGIDKIEKYNESFKNHDSFI